MKNLLIIVLLFIFPLLNNVNSEEKISIINMEFLLENSLAGKAIKVSLQNLNKKNQKFFKTKEDELKKKELSILKQKNVLSKEEYKRNVSTFQNQIQSYRDEKSKKINQLNQLKVKSINELLKQLSPLIAKFSKDNNLSIVMDKKYTIVSMVESDITQKILKILDKNIKKINIK